MVAWRQYRQWREQHIKKEPTIRERYHQWRNQKIVLYFTEGYTTKEIAGKIGLPVRTINRILNECGVTKQRVQAVFASMYKGAL